MFTQAFAQRGDVVKNMAYFLFFPEKQEENVAEGF